jgi:hypothetical protein
MGFQFSMLRGFQFVRSFYRDAASLNSDNRNGAAAKNVTRFAMPVMVADMLYYVGCQADITDNNTLEANRSARQIAAKRFSAVALALEHYADFGPLPVAVALLKPMLTRDL